MATIDVIDGLGAHIALEKPLTPGRSAAATSRPVALSTEDKAALDLLHTDLVAATPAGTNVIGKTGIDQTTPGTTNLVALTAETTKAIGVTRSADGSGNLLTSTGNALDINIKSGANVNGQATMANSAPVTIASNQSGIPMGVTATASGATASRVNAASSTNATSLKASAGQLYTIDVFNAAAYNVFLKLYNKASAPTVGSDTPVMTIPVQAGGGYSKTWPMGLTFATGIAYAITKLQADADTTAVVAGDLTGNTTWI